MEIALKILFVLAIVGVGTWRLYGAMHAPVPYPPPRIEGRK